jgi:hypothetical protein
LQNRYKIGLWLLTKIQKINVLIKIEGSNSSQNSEKMAEINKSRKARLT